MASASRFVMCVINDTTLVYAQRTRGKEHLNKVHGRLSIDGSNRDHMLEVIAFASAADKQAAGFSSNRYAVVNKPLVERFVAASSASTSHAVGSPSRSATAPHL